MDVTGTWSGTVDSTTPRGEPVYGPYTAIFTLQQSGAAVTGTYRSDVGHIGGRIEWGVVSANRLTMSIATVECAGKLQFSGTVREPAGGPAEMDVDYSGETACTGEREDKGTLVRQETPTPSPAP